MIGKGLRYLKTVIVTAAVYEPFFLLYKVIRYSHWAGVAGCTNLFRLAASYVFIKQSGISSHCNPSFHKDGHPISKSYGANLPNSLSQVFLDTP